jgi:hypothetical protein
VLVRHGGLERLDVGKRSFRFCRGTKALVGTDIYYARGRLGARLFFRNVDGGIQIVSKASKANEASVINRLRSIYGP